MLIFFDISTGNEWQPEFGKIPALFPDIDQGMPERRQAATRGLVREAGIQPHNAMKNHNRENRYSEIVATFDRLAFKYGGPVGLEEVNRLKLAPLVRACRGRILDVGCGTGTFIEKYIDPASQIVVSVDFSDRMIALARKRLRKHFNRSLFLIKTLAQTLPFADSTFDACTCINTLHNMPQWEDVADAVAEMARVLRPGGAILIEFRNIRNPVRRKITALYDHDHLPQKAFTVEDMMRLLHNGGLEVEQRIALYGENPSRGTFTDSAMAGLVGARAPRIALLARKAQSFDTFLGKHE